MNIYEYTLRHLERFTRERRDYTDTIPTERLAYRRREQEGATEVSVLIATGRVALL